ncbi:MAG: type IV secretory system conjugative DNA transfer family protein [bacterium]|nr:type IV secretory system conjugative DNA transfer family protein [bacterium]
MSAHPVQLSLLKWAMLGVALGLGGWWGLEAVRLLPRVAGLLQDAGWAAAVQGFRPGWGWWLLACQGEPACQAAFVAAWRDLAHPWRLLVPGGLLIAAGTLRVAADRTARGPHREPGAARWSLPREVARQLRCSPDERPAGYVGCIPGLMRTRVLRLPERRRCSHVLLIGGTGAGKTSRYMKPNLLADARDGHSAVVIDVKFPDPREGLVDVLPAFLACGRDVQLFAPWHPEVTLRFPLLEGVNTLTDAMDLRDLVIGHTERRYENPFFLNLERKLLAALILGVARDGLRPAGDPYRGPATLGRIYRLAAGSGQDLQQYFLTHPDAEVRAQVVGLFGLEDERLPGIMAGLAGRLELFADPLLDRATTPADDPREQVNPQQLGVAPTLLFIALSQTRLAGGRGKLLLQVLVRILNDALMRSSERYGGRLPVHTSVYLDEFPSMGPIPGIGETLATFRSRRVAYHLVLQGRAQGEEVYGVTGFRAFLNNLQTVLLFPAWLKFDDARYFSEALGNATTEQLTRGTTRRGVLPHQRTTYQRPVLRPLLSPEEFADAPDDGAILITTGLRPARVWLPRWFDRPGWLRADPFARLRSLMALPLDLRRVQEAHRRWTQARFPWLAALEPPPAPERDLEQSSESRAADPGPARGELSAPAGPGPAGAPLVELLRALADVQTSPAWAIQARAFDYRGRLTKLVLPREAIAAAGADGPALLLRWLDAGLVRSAGLQVVLPEATCRCLPVDLQAALRRRFGSARRREPAMSTAPATTQPAPRGGIRDLPLLALEALCRWIQEHGRHFDGHPARTTSSPVYGVYRHEELVAVSLCLAARLLARFTRGGDSKVLWEAWRARGWLRHDPDGVTLRLRIGNRRRRWLALTWGAWQTATGHRASDTTVEGSEHETHSSEDNGAATEAERHAGRDAAPAGG